MNTLLHENCLFRQGPTMYPRLAWDSLFRSGWYSTHNMTHDFASRGLGLIVCNTKLDKD